MTSDPSYGTTGFFSYLWTRRKPVFDASKRLSNKSALVSATVGPQFLTDDTGSFYLKDDPSANFLASDSGHSYSGPFFMLTDPNGVILTTSLPTTTVVFDLVRWV